MSVLTTATSPAVPFPAAAPEDPFGADGIQLASSMPASSLLGRDVSASLTATNTTTTDGFNLSFNETVPADVDYVPSSSQIDAVSVPDPLALAQADGSTVLVWTNLSDLLSGTSASLTFDLRPDTTVYEVNDTISTSSGTHVNSDPRMVPDFDPGTGEATTDVIGTGTAIASTLLSPFDLTLTEPSAERELLRGTHQHQTVMTLTVENNLVNSTTGFSIIDHIPASMEFLGCGTVDNTSAPDPGEEYPGVGAIDPSYTPMLENPCVTPTSVSTVVTDPDGDGPLTNDVYTRVEWDSAALETTLGSADLAPAASFALDYVAAIPLRRNVSMTLIDPTANLDNNTGSLTADEELTISHAVASGDHGGVSPSTDEGTANVIAEDVSIHKTVSTGSLAQGASTTWTLLVESSEYATSTDPIVVTDTVPDGLDFASANPALDVGFPVVNGDGTLTLQWTLGGFATPNSAATITFDTITRTDYRSTGAPVAARDSLTNTVALSTTSTVITDNDGSTSALATPDASSAGQAGGGIDMTKEIASPASATMTCGDGSALTFDSLSAGPFRPGDRVCWRLTVDFPAQLDTLSPLIQDHLPNGFAYESHTAGARNTVPLAGTFTNSEPLLEWDIGDIDAGGERFEVVVQTIINDPDVADPADLTGNLLKARYVNTERDVFQLRADVDAEWGEPVLDLVTGVIDVDDVTVSGAPANGVQIEASDVVTFGVTVDNSAGSVDALDVSVRNALPAGIGCADVSAVSHSGTCSATDGWIEWDTGLGLVVSAEADFDLTYDVTIPAGITAGVTLATTAGVRTYQGTTNAGTDFVYVPAANIDSGLTPNTSAADDTSSVLTASPAVDKTRTTSIAEAGNAANNQAAIGERISFSIDVTLPNGTTFYGPAVISDDLGSRLDLDEGSVTFALDGGALPAGWTVSTLNNAITVTFDNPYAIPIGNDRLVEIDFDAVVTDVATNTRPGHVRNRAYLNWEDESGELFSGNDPINTQIVEPSLTLTKTNDEADNIVDPAQEYSYELTVGNASGPQVSTAHDVVIVDIVPAELILLEGPGDPAEHGDIVGSGGGSWDATARTITWTVSSLDPGASMVLDYDVTATDPLLATSALASSAEASTSSLTGTDAGERNADSPNGGQGSGYLATAADTVNAIGLAISKATSGSTVTIGEMVDYTIDVTIPGDTISYDVTVIDDLPAGIAYSSLESMSCAQAGASCSPAISTVSAISDGADVAFLFGDLATPADADRVVTIVYRTIVADVAAAAAGATLTNAATVYLNTIDTVSGPLSSVPEPGSFDSASPTASAQVSVVEPSLSLDKAVEGQTGDADSRRATPGAVLSYTITVANDGSASTSPAHDLTVTDTPDPRLIGFTDTTTSAAVTTVDSDPSDGTLSWSVAGPLSPGETIVISYSLTVPGDLDSSDEALTGPEVVNTADVSSYFGVESAIRAANLDRSYREYDDVANDNVGVELDLASIGDRVWLDLDRDDFQDAAETGLQGIDVTVTYHGPDDTLGGGDDEVFVTTTGVNGYWMIAALPSGEYTVEVDQTDLPAGLTPTYDLDIDTSGPDVVWTGALNEDSDRTDADAGYGYVPANTGLGFDESNPVADHAGNIWVVGLKPDGRALVRMRTPDGTWSLWMEQGSRDWASMSINTDRAGNVWVAGVKNSGAAYVRAKDGALGVTEGWSQWVQQGSGGWSSMSVATDHTGDLWLVGVKSTGTAYVRSKDAAGAVTEGWSSWSHQGSKKWDAVSLATDTSGNLWLAGVTTTGTAYVRRKDVGGNIGDNWSYWMRQGGGSNWVSMNLSTDSFDNLWLAGVKESGTAYARMKSENASVWAGWSTWLQLGSANSWASMTLTVDDADTLWVAGVKESGTAYIRRKCYCAGITEGWSNWWQQGAVNSWESLTVSTDPSNRVMLGGLKLTGTAYVRIKGVESGVSTAWGLWMQQGTGYSWEYFAPHSNAWTGVRPPRTPTLGFTDTEWISPPGWTDATVSVNSSGTAYYC